MPNSRKLEDARLVLEQFHAKIDQLLFDTREEARSRLSKTWLTMPLTPSMRLGWLMAGRHVSWRRSD